MTTTAAVVEILAAGLPAGLCVWLLVRPVFQASLSSEAIAMPAGLVLALVFVLAYPLGWLVNAITYKLARATYCPRYLWLAFRGTQRPTRELLRDEEYRQLRRDYSAFKMALLAAGQQDLLEYLRRETASHRVIRAGSLNFSIACAAILALAARSGDSMLLLPALALAPLAIGCWVTASYRHKRHYRRLAMAQRHVKREFRVPEASVANSA